MCKARCLLSQAIIALQDISIALDTQLPLGFDAHTSSPLKASSKQLAECI
jgi:hypothetical protein